MAELQWEEEAEARRAQEAIAAGDEEVEALGLGWREELMGLPPTTTLERLGPSDVASCFSSASVSARSRLFGHRDRV